MKPMTRRYREQLRWRRRHRQVVMRYRRYRCACGHHNMSGSR